MSDPLVGLAKERRLTVEHLVHVRVAGCMFRKEGCAALKDAFEQNKPFVLRLVPEEKNPHDPNAVAVVVSIDGTGDLQVGYVPREDAARARRFIAENRIAGIDLVRVGCVPQKAAWCFVKIHVKMPEPVSTAPATVVVPDDGDELPEKMGGRVVQGGPSQANGGLPADDDPEPAKKPREVHAPPGDADPLPRKEKKSRRRKK